MHRTCGRKCCAFLTQVEEADRFCGSVHSKMVYKVILVGLNGPLTLLNHVHLHPLHPQHPRSPFSGRLAAARLASVPLTSFRPLISYLDQVWPSSKFCARYKTFSNFPVLLIFGFKSTFQLPLSSILPFLRSLIQLSVRPTVLTHISPSVRLVVNSALTFVIRPSCLSPHSLSLSLANAFIALTPEFRSVVRPPFLNLRALTPPPQ